MAKLREIKVKDAPIKLVWADPITLDENPNNWKIHTDFQTEVVRTLINKHGWIKPLVYNRTTGRLVDGHDRRKIAVAQGWPHVPVILGDWPEAQEAEILATLDPSVALAKSDAEKLDAILRDLADPAPVIQKMLDNLAESEGVLKMLAARQPKAPEPTFVADPEGETYGGTGGPGDDDEGYRDPDTESEREYPSAPSLALASPPPGQPPAPPGSHVKMVQLYLTLDLFPEFNELVEALGEHFGTTTPTDTVMATLRDAREALLEPSP